MPEAMGLILSFTKRKHEEGSGRRWRKEKEKIPVRFF
jgi:hypothetical protein